jgi:hypothetical protein
VAVDSGNEREGSTLALRTLALVVVCACSSSCLVVSINPAYSDTTIAWEPNLVGTWVDADDKAMLQIDRSEWRSYRIHYEHPIERGDLTGYLTIIGDERYLDVMPSRGQDRGSFLIPVHALLRVRLEGDKLELTPLSYDWFEERVRGEKLVPGLDVTMDQKENALITTSVDRLRDWIRTQPADGAMFGASATFTRKPAP